MKKFYILSLLFACSLSFGQVFTATYDFAGVAILAPATAPTNGTTDPTSAPTAPGMTFGNFTALISSSSTAQAGSTAAGRFSYTNQPAGATNGIDTYSTMTGALDPLVYYQVTVTPNSGTTYSLTGITFKSQRSSTGIRTFSVRSSADNYATNLPATVTSTTASVQSGNIFLVTSDANTATSNISTGNAITLSNTNITTPITFRVYGWNSEGSGGSFSIDDFVISGNVSILSTKQFEGISGLSIYPNPAKNILNITSDSFETKTVAIYNVLGKVVLSANVTNTPLNIANLAKGVYVVKVTEADKTATRKLVIE